MANETERLQAFWNLDAITQFLAENVPDEPWKTEDEMFAQLSPTYQAFHSLMRQYEILYSIHQGTAPLIKRLCEALEYQRDWRSKLPNGDYCVPLGPVIAMEGALAEGTEWLKQEGKTD